MTRKMTKEEALAWKERWEAVNRYEIEELRRTPPKVRYLQFLSLMQMAFEFEWTESMEQGVEDVRNRWQRLREHYLGKEAGSRTEEAEGDSA